MLDIVDSLLQRCLESIYEDVGKMVLIPECDREFLNCLIIQC